MNSSKQSSNKTIYVPLRVERMSPEAFVSLVEKNRANIAKSRFVAPKIGGKGFGGFEVEYKVPVLRQA